MLYNTYCEGFVPETAEKVPFPLIDFEKTNDAYGKVIRESIPNWNISVTELQKLGQGDYKSRSPFHNVPVDRYLEYLTVFYNTWKYVTPEDERGEISEEKRKATRLEDRVDMEGMFEYMQGKFQRGLKACKESHDPLRQVAHTTGISKRLLCTLIRKFLSEKLLLNLLGKTRELLAQDGEPTADPTELTEPTEQTESTEPTEPTEQVEQTEQADPTEPTEPTAEPTIEPDEPTADPTEPTKPTEQTEQAESTEPTEPTEPTGETLAKLTSELTLEEAPKTASEEAPEETPEKALETTPEPAPESYGPFLDRADAQASLILCAHLILQDHLCRDYTDINYEYGSYSLGEYGMEGDEFSAPGNVNRASHWSQLYQYLRKDIEQNGPVPEQLQSFYGSVELGSRLERLTVDEIRTFFNMESPYATALFRVIDYARQFYGTDYEEW